jgi:hypothetical protein
MTKREGLIELIAQTLAPRLYQLCGESPEEMGFPIYDTKREVEEHLARQFDPVNYWLERGREMGASIVNIIEAGGGVLNAADLDAMCKAAAKERPDMSADGEIILSIDKLLPASR